MKCYQRVERFDAVTAEQDPYEGRIYLGVGTPEGEGWRQAYYVRLSGGDAILAGSNNAKRGKAEMSQEEWEKQIREEVRESGKDISGEFTGIQYILTE